MRNETIKIADVEIKPGEQVTVSLFPPNLYTQTPVEIPVHVFHGKKAGPRLFVTSTIHGDEISGAEIVRRLISNNFLKTLHGTLIAMPVVNLYGFVLQSRYLPDRRDLNRSFPGSKSGSLAARLANMLMDEIVRKCNYGIDLHTGSVGRSNLPQIRVNLDTPGAADLAKAFRVPVIIDAKLRDGSLREAASELGIPLLVYEAGEALRFNEVAISMGVKGIVNVMRVLGMVGKAKKRKSVYTPMIAQSSAWVRSPTSGTVFGPKKLGATISKDEQLATIHDPFSTSDTPVFAPDDGVIIGINNIPLVNEGDALFHVAYFHDLEKISVQVDEMIGSAQD